MDEYAPQLNKIADHEDRAAGADQDFDAQLKTLQRLISGVALSEVEHDLHEADPDLSRTTGRSLEEIEAGMASNREALQEGMDEAIRIRKLGLSADHDADQARQDLIGGTTGPAS
jgi:hypothetical protein